MATKKPKYAFHLSKTDWVSSKKKWEGIVKSLKTRNERELLEFFEFDCGFCDEVDRCWDGALSDSPASDCQICPLSKNNICIMNGAGDAKKIYWKVNDFCVDLEHAYHSLEDCNKKTLDRIIRFSQRILDAIITAKPARFRKEE